MLIVPILVVALFLTEVRYHVLLIAIVGITIVAVGFKKTKKRTFEALKALVTEDACSLPLSDSQPPRRPA
jgi:hypothetical protein